MFSFTTTTRIDCIAYAKNASINEYDKTTSSWTKFWDSVGMSVRDRVDYASRLYFDKWYKVCLQYGPELLEPVFVNSGIYEEREVGRVKD